MKSKEKCNSLSLSLNKSKKQLNCKSPDKPNLKLYPRHFRNFLPKLTKEQLRTITNCNPSENRSRLLNSVESYAKKTVSPPMEQYSRTVEGLMNNYIYRNPHTEEKTKENYEDDMTVTKQKFFKTSLNNIDKFLQSTRRFNSNDFFVNEDNRFQVNVRNPVYKHPFDSLGLILRNKSIHDQILLNYEDREVQHFGSRITNAKALSRLGKISKNVKITSLMPKTIEKEILMGNFDDDISGNRRKSIALINLSDISKSPNKRLSIKKPKKVNAITLTTTHFSRGYVNLFASYIRSNKLFPESREQFSFEYEPVNNHAYLFSGSSCNISNRGMWKLDLNTLEWNLIHALVSQSPEPRSGHTGCVYKTKYIIFGGKYLVNNLYGDIEFFNMDQNNWTSPQVNSMVYLRLRRNHVACIVGNQMFVHGGISETGEYLNDAHILNLSPIVGWLKANIKLGHALPPLAYHACCLVMSSDISKNSKFNIYKYPEVTIIKRIYSRIKEKGIYIFGGKSKDIAEPTNDLWIIRVGKKPLEWIMPETFGRPPCPRYLCSMNFFEDGNFLVIHGGKTTKNGKTWALNDTYLFELYKMEYIRVEFSQEIIPKERCAHGAVISLKTLIIFGGMNNGEFVGSNLFIINLDPANYQEKINIFKPVEVKKEETERDTAPILSEIIKEEVGEVKRMQETISEDSNDDAKRKIEKELEEELGL